MSMKHAKVAAGTDDPAAEVKFSDWNADHVVDGNGLLIVADTSVPTAPSAGYVTLFGRVLGGGALPAFTDEYGLVQALQCSIGRNKIALWNNIGNTSSSPVVFGMAAPTNTGTATARSVATTNLFTSVKRLGMVSAATAGSVAKAQGLQQYWRGNAAGLGGFRFMARFGCSDAATVAGARTFVGFQGSSAGFGNADPSAQVNIIGVGTDGTDANLQIIYNDGTGAASKIDLGANFPDHTLSIDFYELVLFAPPNGSLVGWEVTRLNTGHVARGTITTDMPASTQLLSFQVSRNNNATALAVGIDYSSVYIETDS